MARERKKLAEVNGNEIKIFKKGQYADIGDQADDQKHFFNAQRPCTFNGYTCEIINDNGKSKDQDIDRFEIHVENTAGNDQHQPPVFVRQQKIKRDDDQEKNEKLDGIK